MEPSKLEKIKQIIRPFLKKPNHRSENEISSIFKLITNIKFFNSISEGKNYQAIISEVAKCLSLEIYEPGENVVNYGEVGDKFYIVLFGKLAVLIPNIGTSRPGSRCSSRAEIRASILKRSDEQENRVKVQARVDRQEIEYLKRLVAPGITANRKESMKLDINFLTRAGLVNQMTEVSELKPGDAFGELALISDKPRAASIEAKEVSILAVLSKAEFKKVLIQETERALKEKINFLEKLPIFQGYSRGLITRLSYYFQEIKYKKGDIVYKENSEATQILFVNCGEFTLSQNIESKRAQIIHNSLDNSLFLLRKNKSRMITQRYKMQYALKGKNEIIGHEEFLNNNKFYKQTCSCESYTGIIFAIKYEDFQTRINLSDSIKFLKIREKRDSELHKSFENAEKIVENFSRPSSRNSISRNSSYSDCEIKSKAMLNSFCRKNFRFSSFRQNNVSNSIRTSSAAASPRSFNITQKVSKKVQPILVRKKSFSLEKKEISRLKRLPPPNFMKLARAANTSMAQQRREFFFK